jgi:molybdopterin synthase sulfur carrier subunit
VSTVVFTANLQRHLSFPPGPAEGRTVRDVLEHVFARVPQARSYVLDDQGGVRKHIAVFINGEPLRDREHQADPVTADSEVYVMQALSGG